MDCAALLFLSLIFPSLPLHRLIYPSLSLVSCRTIHHDTQSCTFSLLPGDVRPDTTHDGLANVSVLADSEGGEGRLKRGRGIKKRRRDEGEEEDHDMGMEGHTAYLTYKMRKRKGVKVMDLMHTYVPDALRGKGLGNMLVDGKSACF
jgi:predicted GNAT family acetyltransferase